MRQASVTLLRCAPRTTPTPPVKRMSTDDFSIAPKMDPEAQALWHEVATASDEVASIVDRIPGLAVTGIETRNELERAAALLKAVANILRRTERREDARRQRHAGDIEIPPGEVRRG